MGNGILSQKSVLVLLLLVVLLVIALVVVTAYYQSSFSEVSQKYYATKNSYDKLISDLQTEKSKLNDTMTRFQLKEKREKDLSSKFESLRDEHTATKKELALTSEELSDTKNELSSTKTELLSKAKALQAEKLITTNLQTSLDSANAVIASYDAEAERLDDAVDFVQSLINDYQSSESTPSSCLSILSTIEDHVGAIASSKNKLQSIS